MSVQKRLYEYLLQYPGIEIITDIEGEEGICGLFPYGDFESIEDCDGNVRYTKRFLVLFKKGTSIGSFEQEDYSWVGDFFEWIEEEAYNYNYPPLGLDCFIEKFTISNLDFYDISEGLLNGTYSAVLEIVYTKEV